MISWTYGQPSINQFSKAQKSRVHISCQKGHSQSVRFLGADFSDYRSKIQLLIFCISHGKHFYSVCFLWSLLMTWPELQEQTAWLVAELINKLILFEWKEQLSSAKESHVWLKLCRNSDCRGDFSFVNTQNSSIHLNLLSKYNKYEGQVHFKKSIYLLNNPAQGENKLGYILNLKTPQNNSKDSV